MATIAQIDKFNTLTGFRKVKKPHDGDVVVPDDCDLAPGRYRWDAERGAFMPIARRDPARAMAQEPRNMRAIARGFAALRDQGFELPRETLDWIGRFEQPDGKEKE